MKGRETMIPGDRRDLAQVRVAGGVEGIRGGRVAEPAPPTGPGTTPTTGAPTTGSAEPLPVFLLRTRLSLAFTDAGTVRFGRKKTDRFLVRRGRVEPNDNRGGGGW